MAGSRLMVTSNPADGPETTLSNGSACGPTITSASARVARIRMVSNEVSTATAIVAAIQWTRKRFTPALPGRDSRSRALSNAEPSPYTLIPLISSTTRRFRLPLNCTSVAATQRSPTAPAAFPTNTTTI